MERKYTDKMDVSGMGGAYEDACRAMILAGCDWLDAHPDAVPKFASLQGVFGYVKEENEDAESLSEAVAAACDDCTGAMHHQALLHVWFIKQNGWDKYTEEMEKRYAEKNGCAQESAETDRGRPGADSAGDAPDSDGY